MNLTRQRRILEITDGSRPITRKCLRFSVTFSALPRKAAGKPPEHPRRTQVSQAFRQMVVTWNSDLASPGRQHFHLIARSTATPIPEKPKAGNSGCRINETPVKAANCRDDLSLKNDRPVSAAASLGSGKILARRQIIRRDVSRQTSGPHKGDAAPKLPRLCHAVPADQFGAIRQADDHLEAKPGP